MWDQSHAPRTRRRILAETFCIAATAVLGRGGVALAQTPAQPSGPAWPRATFPLSIATGKRYLEDAEGQPFLMQGDTAWSLIAQLTREDAQKYLDDRQARGFNAILVNLIEHRFSSRPPANIYGHQPFHTPGDFTTPNDDYFAHADWIVREAAERGILVLLAPAYLGSQGGAEGWYRDMLANGPAKLRAYGEYLGRRYGGFTNILWVHGGDYDPPHREVVRAVAEGIRALAPRVLSTAHCGPETAAIDYWQGEPWLQLDNVYTYGPVHTAARKRYARPERMPFFLIESAYENEHGATELRVRAQAYHAVLSGAAGHIYGNNPMWHFDGPGLHRAPMHWHEAMDSLGARSMTHLRSLFETLPWWRLEPEDAGVLMESGEGTGQERALAAYVADKSVAVVFLPTLRKVRIDLRQLAGREVRARWYDPAGGRFRSIAGSPFVGDGSHLFQPETLNSAGLGDWVLLLESGSP